MRVIGVVGLPGSGKGEVAAVAGDLDIPVVSMGDVVRETCRERGLDPAVHHGRIARQLREEDGPGAIADRSLPAIEAALGDAGTVIVDGIRSDAEVEAFEAAFGDGFTLLLVDAPFEVRAERIADRGRDDPDAETLEERDERELGFGMDAAMEAADVVIENAGSLESFHRHVRDILE